MAHSSPITTQALTVRPEKQPKGFRRHLLVKVLGEFSINLGDNFAVPVAVFVFIVADLGKASLQVVLPM